MDLTLQHLRMLREVSRRKTIAAAAESLGYTRSAVSQQLVGLEKSTGVAVLERVGRGVQLTDAGRELVRHADELLAGMEAAQVSIERVAGEARGGLAMGVYESVAGTLLPGLLSRLGQRFPDLRLQTRELDPDLAIDNLVMGEIDLSFVIDYPHAPSERRHDIVRTTIMEDRFHLVVPPGEPLDAEGPVALARFADRDFIAPAPSSGCGSCVVLACRDAGFEPMISHQLDDYPTTLQLVSAGQGVALVSDLGLVLGRRTADVQVLELAKPVSRSIQLAHRSASSERPAIAAVRQVLVEVAADLAA